MYEEDKDIPTVEDEEFEDTAMHFQNKYKMLSAKFQNILLQESTLNHRTSELCQMQQLMIDDLKNEIHEIRVAELEDEKLLNNNEKPSEMDLNNFYSLNKNNNTVDDIDGSDSVKDENSTIKMEIKIEQGPVCDNKKFEILENVDNNDKQQTFHVNNLNSQQLSTTSNNIDDVKNNVKLEQQSKSSTLIGENKNKNSNNNMDKVKEEFEQFDIESEITPSFIMKKVENKKESTKLQSNKGDSKKIILQTNDREKSFNDVYLASSNNKNKHYDIQTEQQTNQTQLHTKIDQDQQIEEENKNQYENVDNLDARTAQTSFTKPQQEVQQQYSEETSKTQQQDDDQWITIQKELNLINDSKVQQLQQQQQQHPETNNHHQITNGDDLFPNGCIDTNKQQQQQQQNSENDSIGEFFDSTDDDEVQRSVETRLEAMFGESPVPLGGDGGGGSGGSGKNDNDTQDEIESGLEEIFGPSKSPDVSSEPVASMLDAIKNKRLWENEMASGNNFMRHDQQQQQQQPPQQKHYYNNTNNSSPHEQQQQQYATNNQEHQQQAHHIQLNCNNNPRWMQTMEAQYTNDFNGTINMNGNDNVRACGQSTRKRHWNHQDDLLSNNDFVPDEDDNGDVEHGEPHNKKICNSNTDFSIASSSMSSSSSSSTSSSISAQSASPVLQEQQQQQHIVPTLTHQHDIANLLLHDDMRVNSSNNNNVTVNGEFTQMLHEQQQHQQQNHFNVEQQQQHQQQHQQQQQQQHQQQFGDIMMSNVDMMQQQHNHQHHYAHMHHLEEPQELQQQQQQLMQQQQPSLVNTTNNHVEFDDDISRHVQNAIDSILNLQNSESDSLPFSLDHSMGSLLGDSILDDRQSNNNNNNNNNTTAIVTANMVSSTMINQCQPIADINSGMLVAPSTIASAIDINGAIINNKRSVNLVDELGDCLISGASQCGDNASNILMTHQQYQQQQQQQQYTHNNINNHHESQQQQFHHQNTHLPQAMLHQPDHQHHQQQPQSIITTTAPGIPEVLNDFSSMVANIDEAVKSFMGS